MTKFLGVIGDPIDHSLSPLIHNGWIRDMGFNANYHALHVPVGEFSSALKTLENQDCLGVNVTLPHKAKALEEAHESTDTAQAIGAANTLSYLGQSNWRADNTDAPGFLDALGTIDQEADHVLILGAGGSARAIAYALSVDGQKVTILNRTVEKARQLASACGGNNSAYGSIENASAYFESATIVINTTSMGYGGEIFDLPKGKDRIFFDISYGKTSARQIDHASTQGWRTRDGLNMLVAQAAFSFEIWFGEMPDREAGLRRCRAALEALS